MRYSNSLLLLGDTPDMFRTFRFSFIPKSPFPPFRQQIKNSNKKKIAMSVAKNICLWRKFVPIKKNLPVLANASSCSKEIKPGTMHISALGMLTFNVIRLAQCLCQANKQHKKSFYVADNLLKIGGILKCTPTQQLLATGRGGERVSS